MTTTRPRILTGGKVLATLLTFFGVVFAVNLTMTVFAIETLSGTDVASTYAASLAYNHEIEAAHQQDARHWNVVARAARNAAEGVDITLEARDAQGVPIDADFSIRLQRPVDKRLDRAAALDELGHGIYRTQLSGVEPGRWDLLIEADTDGKPQFRSKSRIWLD